MRHARRLSALVLALATLALGASGCSSPEARKARALEKGNKYLAEGNLAKAGVEFRNALQLAPNDGESRYRTGIVLERQGNVVDAVKFYRGALEVDPDLAAARADLGRIYIMAGGADKAIELVQVGLAKSPKHVGLLTVRGAARAQLNDVAGAFDDLELAHQLDPHDPSALAALAGLYNSNARSDKASALLEQGIKEFPKNADLRLALADIDASLGELGKAEGLLRELVALQPEQRAHRLRLAQFLSRQNKDDAALGVLHDAIASLPKDAGLKAALVEFLSVKKGRDAAEQELQRLSAAQPDDMELRFALAQFYSRGNEPAKAEQVLRAVIDKRGTGPDGLTARTRLATLKALAHDGKAADALIAEVLAASPRDADALALRGNLLLAKGDAKGAIADLRSVLRDQPNAIGLMRALARAHLQNGEPALAEETLRRAVEQAPGDSGARLDLAQLLVQLNHPEQGKALLVGLTHDHPEDAQAQDSLFRVSLATRDLVAAHSAAAALVAAEPKAAVGYLYEGMLAGAEGHSDEAIAAYRKALEAQPATAEPLNALVGELVRRNRAAEALQAIDREAAKVPASPVPAQTRGELLLLQKHYPEATQSFRAALALAPRWWLPYRGLAFVAAAGGDAAAGVKLLEEAVAKVDDPAALRMELAQRLEALNRPADAMAQYEALLKAAPSSAVAANNLAMLLVTHRTDAASLARAGELTKAFADSPTPQFLDTYGWVAFKRGDTATALAALQKAESTHPDVAVLLFHLGAVQSAVGDKDAARANLTRALAGGGAFPGADEARTTLARLIASR